MKILRAISQGAWLGVRTTAKYISRWASGFAQSLHLFFRALGLGILTVVRRGETPKVLIYTSKRQAVFHSVTHILPILVSTTLIGFNLQGFFIGRELQGEQNLDGLKMGVIQIAAKVQVRDSYYYVG